MMRVQNWRMPIGVEVYLYFICVLAYVNLNICDIRMYIRSVTIYRNQWQFVDQNVNIVYFEGETRVEVRPDIEISR